MDKIGLYTFSHRSMLILIPKKKSNGYLKSVFGFHSSNKEHQLFQDLAPDWFCGDTCDIDGHLSIDLKLNNWDKDFNKGVDETLKALLQCFPHVSEFKEDYNLFWDNLIK